MQLVAVPRDRRQIYPAAMGCPGLGGLRQGLECMLRTDPLEMIGAEVEKTAIVHAGAVDADGNLTGVDHRPRGVGILAIPV